MLINEGTFSHTPRFSDMSNCIFVLESDGNQRISIDLLGRTQFNNLTVLYSGNYIRDNFEVMYAIF